MLGLALWLFTHQGFFNCETYAPRLDGSRVTVCEGRVVAVRSAHPGTVVDQIEGGVAVLIHADGRKEVVSTSRLPKGAREGQTVALIASKSGKGR